MGVVSHVCKVHWETILDRAKEMYLLQGQPSDENQWKWSIAFMSNYNSFEARWLPNDRQTDIVK